MGTSDEMTKDVRRKLRKKLKEDLIKLQGLSTKLEARELQLRQSRSVTVHPSLSDAQFSGNDLSVRGAGGKEVTSQLDLTSNGLGHHTVQLTKQQSFGASNGSPIGAELLVNKRTPKASQVYKKSEFFVGKDKLPPPVKSRTKLNSENGQEGRIIDEGNHKRKLFGIPNEYRPQCGNILKKLMGHEDGWIFNEPVDAVKLSLSDYHSVIKKPMDLGTIKRKLDKKQYASLSEFADDIRLTFNNAMTYNPQGNDVHQAAYALLTIFQRDWDVLNEKLERTDGDGEVDVLNRSSSQLPEIVRATSGTEGTLTNKTALPSKNSILEKPKVAPAKPKAPPGKTKVPPAKPKAPAKPETPGKPKAPVKPEPPVKLKGAAKSEAPTKPKASAKSEAPVKPKAPPKPKASEKVKALEKSKVTTKPKAKMPKKVMNYEEKVRLQTTLGQLPQQMLEELILLMKERNINMSQEGDEIEVDLDSFDDETLWELDRRAKLCLKGLQKAAESRKRQMEDCQAEKTNKKQKVLDSALPANVTEKKATSGNKSSSESGSSSDSDSGSSSTSDSDG